MAERIVLFICVENACRSLMAEAMFNRNAPAGWRARSAGTSPADTPNPRTAPMLGEIGLELPDHPPQILTPALIEEAKIRVTMGCLDDAACPARLKELEYRDWGLPDPAQLDDVGFRRIRDMIQERVEGLAREIRLNERMRAARAAPA
jgi:arsenate reductase (thioredoxin)